MSEKTGISWADSTASPWTGCTEVSPGCLNCYSRELAKRYGWCGWGKGVLRHRFKGFEKACLRMNREPWICEDCGCPQKNPNSRCSMGSMMHRRRIFPSLMDWLDPEVPVAWLADMLDVIRRCPDCDFLLLTKRPELWEKRMMQIARGNILIMSTEKRECGELWVEGEEIPDNIWVGTTVENQEMAHKRIPELLKIPARVRFLSCEPLLTSINLGDCLGEVELMTYSAYNSTAHCAGGIDWAIVGCESGPHRRNMFDVTEHSRYIKQQCQTASVPVFVKQLPINGKVSHDPQEWPSDMRVQQFPEPKR